VVLLPGYVFVHTTDAVRRTLFPDGSQGYLSVNGQPATLSEAEIERLRRVCAWEGTPEIDYSLLRKGQTVTVLEGHFAGLNGEVIGHQGHHLLRLAMPILGCTMVVNITGAAVQAVS
jgi:transcription antitermination factor NusG